VGRLDLPAVAGLFLFALGVAVLVDAGVVGNGVSADLTTYVGTLALVAGAILARLAVAVEQSTAEPPTVETKAALPVPGATVDDLLAKIDANPVAAIEEYEEIRERLTTVAVALLADRYGLREPAARDSLEAGTWTDDPHAAAFFIGQYPEWAPLRLQLRDRAAFTRTPPSMQAEHVATELLAIADGERDGLDPTVRDSATTNGESGTSPPARSGPDATDAPADRAADTGTEAGR